MITLLRTTPDPRNTLNAAQQHMLQPYNDSFFFERKIVVNQSYRYRRRRMTFHHAVSCPHPVATCDKMRAVVAPTVLCVILLLTAAVWTAQASVATDSSITQQQRIRQAHVKAGLSIQRDKERVGTPLFSDRAGAFVHGGQCPACGAGNDCCGGLNSTSGQFCCPSNTTCCQDTCCSNATDYTAETCCPDPTNGGVCCLKETTFCCPPNPSLDQPSRCCPRWNVCCNIGRYGCCDPTSGKPMEESINAPAAFIHHDEAGHGHSKASAHGARSTNGRTAYAIFEETSIWTDNARLWGAQIDLVSGNVTQIKVQEGVFHTEQETTRKFLFDRHRGVFMLPQANFTDPSLDFPITLYTIDPISGNVTAVPVTGGARDEVTGYHLNEEHNTIVMSTSWVVDNERVGYNYWHVDPQTAVATFVSRLNNSHYSTQFPDGDTYAGWFHEISPNMEYVYRIGFRSETDDTDFGLGITAINTENATILPWVSLQDPTFHGRLRSLHRTNTTIDGVKNGKDDPLAVTFVSLSQSSNVTTSGDLGVFMWTPLQPTQATLLAQFGNAHLQAYFGPVAEGFDPTRTKYAAAVVADSILGDSFDTWTLGLVDVVTKQSTMVAVTPTLLASTDSISAFGIPAY
jgi:hypothetical protein